MRALGHAFAHVVRDLLEQSTKRKTQLRVGIAATQLRRLVLVDRLGQTTRIDFDGIERNPRLEPSSFSFTPPPGVDVVGRAPAEGR